MVRRGVAQAAAAWHRAAELPVPRKHNDRSAPSRGGTLSIVCLRHVALGSCVARAMRRVRNRRAPSLRTLSSAPYPRLTRLKVVYCNGGFAGCFFSLAPPRFGITGGTPAPARQVRIVHLRDCARKFRRLTSYCSVHSVSDSWSNRFPPSKTTKASVCPPTTTAAAVLAPHTHRAITLADGKQR